jgi:hypothetical protein
MLTNAFLVLRGYTSQTVDVRPTKSWAIVTPESTAGALEYTVLRVCSKCFITLMDIQGWEWRIVLLLEDSTHVGILAYWVVHLEGMLDNILRKPCKVELQLSKILLIFYDLMFMSLVQPKGRSGMM